MPSGMSTLRMHKIMDPKLRDLMFVIRSALLAIVDGIERYINFLPTTSQVRKYYKDNVRKINFEK